MFRVRFPLLIISPLTRPLLPLIPENIRSNLLSSTEAEALIYDFDSAQHYLDQFSQDIFSPIGFRRKTQSYEDLLNTVDKTHDFSQLQQHYRSHFSGKSLTVETWNSWFDENDELTVSPFYISCNIFCGGIEPNLRKLVWPRLLKAVAWKEKRNFKTDLKVMEYEEMKRSWVEILSEVPAGSPGQISPQIHEGAVGDENEAADVVSLVVERHYRIDKDVARTDQTVPFFTMVKLYLL